MTKTLQLKARAFGRTDQQFKAIWAGYKAGRCGDNALDYHIKNLDGFSAFVELQRQDESSRILPILFSAAMMRALLAGDKTQTRRLATSPLRKLNPGDRLYTREAFRAASCFDHLPPSRLKTATRIDFEADDTDFNIGGKLRPAMHMPRFMSRATLTVTDVKREPLQDITAADAIAEGVGAYLDTFDEFDGLTVDPLAGFEMLWNSLHGENSGKAWADNPELVAVTFTVQNINIDKIQTGGA